MRSRADPAAVRLAPRDAPRETHVMATYLFKTEPDEFSWDDLVRDARAPWDGVANNAALIHLRACRPGDEVFIYHTGAERRIVGLARVVREPYEDPSKPGVTRAGEPKFAVVDIEPIRPAPYPVTLAAIKADPQFAAFTLVTQSRLSVMPVPAPLDRAIRTMAGL